MPGFIDFFTGFESQAFQLPNAGGVSGLSSQVISGWAWWMLVSAECNIDNTAGAVPANPQCAIQYGNLEVCRSFTNLSVTNGQRELISWGHGLVGVGLANVGRCAGLPFLPIIGEGLVRLGFSGGDVNTSSSAVVILIIGRRYKNRGPA